LSFLGGNLSYFTVTYEVYRQSIEHQDSAGDYLTIDIIVLHEEVNVLRSGLNRRIKVRGRPVSRVLSFPVKEMGNHSSGIHVTVYLERLTRGRDTGRVLA